MDNHSSDVAFDHAKTDVCDLLFSALLRPHRSLKPRTILVILAMLGLFGLLLAVPFIFLGFWPVAFFYGLDIALLYWAFRYNMRGAMGYEEIKLSSLELNVRKVDDQGKEASWSFTPIWTRLEQDLGSDQEIRRLRLVSRGVTLAIADCLSQEDRQDFSHSLSSALRDARKGPVFQNSL